MAKKKVRKIRRPFSFMTFLGVIAVFAIAGFLAWFWLSLNQTHIVARNRITEAQRAAAQGRYEESVDLLKKSYEVNGNDTEISNALVRCSAYAVYRAYYEDALAMLDEGRQFLKDPDIVIDAEDEMYCTWADFNMRQGAYESAVLVLEDGVKHVSGRRCSAMLEEITGSRDDAEIRSRLQLIAEDAQKFLVQRDYEGALSALNTQDYRNLIVRMHYAEDPQPIIVETSGLKAGLYPSGAGGAVFYYGDYDGDVRQGHGILLGVNLYSNTSGVTYQKYYADGQWENDIPQGAQTEYCSYTMGLNHFALFREGSVVNGLWNGTVRTWNESKPSVVYEPVYDNGVPAVLRSSAVTKRDNVIAEGSDGTTLGISDDMVGKKIGIAGFGE
ncbi:MAG: hypothetical protein IKS37_02925 [Solobacterium sp.]|nr:hypothetical protein [Solobacterium sp.]